MKANLLSLGLILGMPIASLMMANPATASIFNLTPLELGNGLTVSGTVTTNGTIGNLSASNFTAWNITVQSVNEIVYNKTNSPSAISSLVSVTPDRQKITVATSPDGFEDGGTLEFFRRRPDIYSVGLANFTSPFLPGGQAFYVNGGNFDFLPLNQPDATDYVAAQASSPGSNIFNLVPLYFQDGITTMSGMIATDGTTGLLSESNLLNWNIIVTQTTTDIFNERNSRVLASDGVVTDGSTITVTNSDGDNPGGSWSFGLPGFPGRIDPTVVQLADFTDPTIMGGQAYYLTPLGYQGTLSPLSSAPNYVAATVASNPPTVPEPSMGFGIQSIGIVLGLGVLFQRKSER
jgi:hypothetical protein